MPTFPRIGIARASVILPAAGVYDPTPIAVPTENTNHVSFMITYQRGGAAGAVSFKVEISNDMIDWYQTSDVRQGTLMVGNDIADPIQRVEFPYTATGAGVEKFMTPTFIIAGKAFRVSLKESGNPGAPGIAQILFSAWGNY